MGHKELGVNTSTTVTICSSACEFPTFRTSNFSVIKEKALDFFGVIKRKIIFLRGEWIAILSDSLIVSRAETTYNIAFLKLAIFYGAFSRFHIPIIYL